VKVLNYYFISNLIAGRTVSTQITPFFTLIFSANSTIFLINSIPNYDLHPVYPKLDLNFFRLTYPIYSFATSF